MVSLSSWQMFRPWMQYAVQLHSLHFDSSILYGGIRRSWCRENLSMSCIRILNRPLPTWKISRRLKSHLFPNPHHVESPDPTDRSRHWSRRSVVYSVRWRMHSIAINTRNNYASLNPLADSIPGFSGLGVYMVASFRTSGFQVSLLCSPG